MDVRPGFFGVRQDKTEDVMEFHVAVIPGDGIGPEIVAEARKVLGKAGL